MATMVYSAEDTKIPSIMTACITMTVCICIVVPTRFFVRGVMVGKLGADDWCIGVATILAVSMNSLIMLSTKYGAGRHISTIDGATLMIGLKYNYITQVLTVPSLATVKISIGLFMLRLAATKPYKIICISFLVLMSSYSLASTFTIIFQCFPVEAIWDSTVPNQKCMSTKVRVGLGYTFSIVTVLSDFFLVILPIVMLWHTQIPTRQRIVICGILGIGTFAGAASLVKAVYVVNYGKTGDFLWDSSDIAIWTVIEVGVGIVSASMPALKPLFKRALEKTLSYSGSRSQSRNPGSNGVPLSSLHRSQNGGGTGIKNEIRSTTNNCRPRGGAIKGTESEEEIIGISKTTDLRVDVETVSTSSADIAPGSPMGFERDDRHSQMNGRHNHRRPS